MRSVATTDKKTHAALVVTKNVVKALVIIVLAVATAVVLFVGMR